MESQATRLPLRWWPMGAPKTDGWASQSYQLGEKRWSVGAEAPLENQLSK